MPMVEPKTLPNIITVGRIVLAPAVFFLALTPGFATRLLAFLLFLVAAFSDVWDGYLARKHGWISDFGKLVDPLADKLLLVATMVPFYILSHRPGPYGDLPFWGELPLWVLLVIFGRELLVTIVRGVAVRHGRVIPAGKAGKWKALLQNLFSGTTLLWYALVAAARANGWTGTFWEIWTGALHGPVVAVTLLLALILTVYSMLVYFWRWRGPEAEARA